MLVTRTVIRLGNTTGDGGPVLDPDVVGTAENASALVATGFANATMSVETVEYSTTSNLSFDGANGGDTVTYYQRDHESINNATRADVYFGRDKAILKQRERIKQKIPEVRRLHHRQHAA